MNIRFEELTAPQRAGGIESATRGLVVSLKNRGVSVVRSSLETDVGKCRPDLVHFHGTWSPALAIRWLFWRLRKVPCVISPHGMLEPWALAHKSLKKKVAWHLYQRHILNWASALHATSVREADNLRQLGLMVPIFTIPWGIEVVESREELSVDSCQWSVEDGEVGHPDAGNSVKGESGDDVEATAHGQPTTDNRPRVRTVLFVGRIYPVKGLPMLVEAWAKVGPMGWKMKIVGPDEAGHRAEVEALISEAKLEGDFEFTGALEGEALSKTYADADLLILPSHTENFGLVVGEALAHGLPVITTQGAPWELLETARCGWWAPVSVDGIAAALDDATHRSPEELIVMGARGRAAVAERFAWDRIAGQFIDCYSWVLGEGPQPGCVS